LDDLRDQLEEAEDNARKLLNLRKRLSKIRVFDPACGSGNFLVIAYKEMRKIEAEINRRRKEIIKNSVIPLTNFRGIELRDFSAEIARLALIIAEYQCDVVYRGQKLALAEFLPLEAENWITCGNALRIDWLSVCPPTNTAVKLRGDDLFSTPLDQTEIDFENEGGETYICGNPPFKGSRKQSPSEKEDLKSVFSGLITNWKNIDYVGGWLIKAALYYEKSHAPFAFVATNSLCQGEQVPIIWTFLLSRGFLIRFAHTSFKWSNLASNQAGVTVVVVGVDKRQQANRCIYTADTRKLVEYINPYLTQQDMKVVVARKSPYFNDISMEYGVYYSKSRGLLLDSCERLKLVEKKFPLKLLRSFIGSSEFIDGKNRFCLWLDDSDLPLASQFSDVRERIDSVKQERLATVDKAVNKLAVRPHQFRERKGDQKTKILIPIHSSENREYLPVGYLSSDVIVSNAAFTIFDPPMWVFGLLSSKTHLVWIATVCGKLETRYRYSNTLGWNTFPVPKLTEKNKADLTKCAEDILLAREAHFPATIADLYNPENMPDNLRQAHDRNDETLERIYIGRRFKNDTERLEKLFEMYTKMTSN
jgi:hypothetical protein